MTATLFERMSAIARGVACFACDCGARDEVKEPAPDTVDCWACKRALSMRRWIPKFSTPINSAREATEEEKARL